MNDDSAVGRVIRDLRGRATGAPAGTRLPSVRELIAGHHVSPLTVQRAIRALVAEGIVDAHPGRGTYVAARIAAAATPDLSWQTVALGPRPDGEEVLSSLLAEPPPGAIVLSGGYLAPDLQPIAALGAALARAARRPASWAKGPVAGRDDLRAWFAREAGGGLRPDDMVICAGGQAALSTTFRALAAPGDPVLVESPTYLGAIAVARASGLRVIPVPADTGGVRPDLLAATFERTGARLYYCQPLYANPSGASLAPDRHAAVSDAVRAAGAFLIEDDYARDLTIDGEPPPPLAAADPDGHVVHVRSLTKSSAPALRVAAIGARGPAGERLRTLRVLDDFYVAGPLQEAAMELVSSPTWQRHRKALRAALRTRRDALLAALARHLPDLTPAAVPHGGLHLWARLPDGTDDTQLAATAATHGVVVFPGRRWYAGEAPAPHLRLTYGTTPPELFDEAIRRLARAVDAQRAD